jgi:hypothetical protein
MIFLKSHHISIFQIWGDRTKSLKSAIGSEQIALKSLISHHIVMGRFQKADFRGGEVQIIKKRTQFSFALNLSRKDDFKFFFGGKFFNP